MDLMNVRRDAMSAPAPGGTGALNAELAEVARETARLLSAPEHDDAALSALDARAHALREQLRAERAVTMTGGEDCWPWQSGRNSGMISGG